MNGQPGAKKGARVLPPALFLGALALQALLHFALPMKRLPVLPWRLLGLAPLAAGLALNLLADRAFKQRGTTVQPFGESSALVTGGVFALSRNPMYLGMMLILAGAALLLGSAAPFGVVAAFALLVRRVFVAPEERKLEETFGDRFREYRARVRRWL